MASPSNDLPVANQLALKLIDWLRELVFEAEVHNHVRTLAALQDLYLGFRGPTDQQDEGEKS